MRREPLAEMYQVKGASECALGVGSTDEECSFEQVLEPCDPGQENGCALQTSFARQGLKVGLELDQELGFNPATVYRAVVYRTTDLQHHMVTLWFEDPSDPWVLDPTGAMTDSMVKMSEADNWVALKVFSQNEQFSVQHGPRRNF